MKLSDTEKTKNFKLLQVGESGAGKTHRALTATVFGPVFFIDTDDKVRGFASKLDNAQKELVEFHTCRNAKDVMEAVKYARDNIDKFATIVFDTWSRWHDFCMDAHVELNPAKRPTVKNELGATVAQLTMPDWGAIKQLNKKMLLHLLSLDANIIVNTHVGKATGADDRQVLTVGTTGSFGQEMPQYFPETHYLYINMDGKFRVKGKRAQNIIANSSLQDDLFDSAGNFKDDTLNVFKEVAKHV